MAGDDEIIEALLGEFRLDDNASVADQEALQALRRTIDNPTQVLARYLRESLFIHPVVRRHLASALDGGSVYGTRLVMEGGGSIRDESKALEARRDWLKIGRWIEDRRAAGSTREDALVEAEELFDYDYETCRKANSYAQRFQKFYGENKDSPEYKDSPQYQKYGIGWMEINFHHDQIESARRKKGRSKRPGYRY